MRDHEEVEKIYDQITTTGDVIAETTRSRIIFKNKPRNLCERCKDGHIHIRKYRNEMVVFCRNIERVVPDDIDECNSYIPLGRVSLWDLSKLATLIEKPKNDGGHYL
jgi:hypothetical protein